GTLERDRHVVLEVVALDREGEDSADDRARLVECAGGEVAVGQPGPEIRDALARQSSDRLGPRLAQNPGRILADDPVAPDPHRLTSGAALVLFGEPDWGAQITHQMPRKPWQLRQQLGEPSHLVAIFHKPKSVSVQSLGSGERGKRIAAVVRCE